VLDVGMFVRGVVTADDIDFFGGYCLVDHAQDPNHS
jgi:hypothetical protein